MRFTTGDKVVYKNAVHEIVEYNTFYEDYTLKTSGGHYVYAVKDLDLEEYE